MLAVSILFSGCMVAVRDPGNQAEVKELSKKVDWTMNIMSLKAKYIEKNTGAEKEGTFTLKELYEIKERTDKK